jgi:hypothetical protein
MRPDNEASRRTGHPTTRRTPDDRIAEGETRIADHGDGVDPRAIGDLLNTWLAIKLDTVDGLVDDARRKVDSIPDMRVLASIVGEQFILLRALETEVAQLRAELERLQQRRRVA